MVIENTISEQLILLSNQLKVLTDSETAQQMWADGLATIIANAILSATVVGITSTVLGTAEEGFVTGTATQNNIVNLQ